MGSTESVEHENFEDEERKWPAVQVKRRLTLVILGSKLNAPLLIEASCQELGANFPAINVSYHLRIILNSSLHRICATAFTLKHIHV